MTAGAQKQTLVFLLTLSVLTLPFQSLAQKTKEGSPQRESKLTKKPSTIKRSNTREKKPLSLISDPSVYIPTSEPNRPRSTFFPPFFSFLLPGFDQFWEGQYKYGLGYLGVRLVASNVRNSTAEQMAKKYTDKEIKKKSKQALSSKDDLVRKLFYSGQLIQVSQSFSGFHAFRTAVATRRSLGEYEFYTSQETPLDILAAPFDFSYITRPTTYIPLAIITGLMALRKSASNDETLKEQELKKSELTPQDLGYSLGFSYGAGTSEEVLFRGWLQPMLHQNTGSSLWANILASSLFAAAHLGTNSFPLPQLLLGYHLGDVAQESGYQLAESVFIHTWWDIIAFISQYQYEPEKAVLWFPPVALSF